VTPTAASALTAGRFRKRPLLAALLAALSVMACAEAEKGIPHPVDRLHYPTTLAADPNGRFLYVVSSNFDVRYRTGAVTAIDLATWELLPQTAIGIGDFGGELTLHAVDADGYRAVGYVASRANRSLNWFTVAGGEDGADAPTVDCGDDPGAAEDGEVRECDAAHTITAAERKRLPRDDEGLEPEQIAARRDRSVGMSLGLDVYGTTVYPGRDGVSDYLLVTNPRSGNLSLFHIAGGYPMKPGASGQAAGDSLEGSRPSAPGEPVFLEQVPVWSGVFGVTVTPDGDRAYATSRFANALLPFRLTEIPDPKPGVERFWPTVTDLFAVPIPTSAIVGDYGRELVFDAAGTRAFVAYRNPSSVVVIDTTPGADGVRANRFLAAADVGLQPTALAVAPTGPGGADRLYVVCFGAEELWVLDPQTLDLEERIELPGGPFDLVVVADPTDGRLRAYVTMFALDAVAVVDLDPTSPFFHRPLAFIRGVDDEGAHQ
jgi:DNA-binding beta-propeller fold protein YncE